MIVLALESSTSSAKAMLYDTQRGVLAVSGKPYPTAICENGVSDTAAVSRLTLSVGAEIARGRDVEAVALCGTWHNLSLCEDLKESPGKTYSWNFLAPSAHCAQLRKDEALTDALYKSTGCMPHVTYPRQALWYLKNNGMTLSDKQLISQGSYTFYLLTGEYCETNSTMSGSGLLNLHTLQYDDEVLKLLGLKREQLGPLCTFAQTRPLTEAGADCLGIPKGIPVVPAYPDGALNQISSCAAEVGRMTLSMGTSAAIRLTAERPVLPDGHQLWCYYGVTGYLSGAATSGACNCVDWFLRDCLNNRWSFDAFEQAPETMEELPVFLPFLFGERCPGWRDDRRGGFVNLQGGHTVFSLYRGLQAGLLFHLYQCFEILRQMGGSPSDILVSGGILHSPKWTQMLADIFGREIACMPNSNASSMGAVLLALQAAGALQDVRDYRADYDNAVRVRPREAFRAYYETQYQAYRSWYEKTSV